MHSSAPVYERAAGGITLRCRDIKDQASNPTMQPLHVTPPTVRPPPRFPLRTVLLMVLALLAFLQLFWRTHRPAPPRAHLVPPGVKLRPKEKP